jgi:hypothetical protein
LPTALGHISSSEYVSLKTKYDEANATAQNIREQVRSMSEGQRGQQNAQNFLRIRSSVDRAQAVKADLDLFEKDGTPRTLAMGVLDNERPMNSPILVRGDIKQPGDIVPRGLVEVLCAKGEPLNISQGSGRLDLAYFIASKDNPLTARVMVNRLWLKLMGSGIVATPDNFGVMGMKPSHPELLDHLGCQLHGKGLVGETNDPRDHA